jgi:tetratricopeptide (TPR) repeat protein
VPDHSRIDDLRRRVQKDPSSIAFAQLAEECRRARLTEEAVEVCRQGLEIHPGYLSARVTLGRALLELNQLDEAEVELKTVLASAPENLAAIRGLAEIFDRRGALPEALAQYRAALALARNDPDLQQTVDDLARKVEPAPTPSSNGLSFEQARQEFMQFGVPSRVKPSAEAAPAEPISATAPAEPQTQLAAPAPEPDAPLPPAPPGDAPAGQAERTVAALEEWLTAIDVARADRRA